MRSHTHWMNSCLIDLLVRSQSLRLVQLSIPTATTQNHSWTAPNQRRPAESKRVRFAEGFSSSSCTTTLVKESGPSKIVAAQPLQMNLRSSGDMCSQLYCQVGSKTCSGYLDTPDHLRHYLSPVCSPECDHSECLNLGTAREPTSLNKIFSFAVERSISVPDQICLALKLVRAVLQLHSTPWLQPYWSLQDLSYFQTNQDLATSLASLHISTELSHVQQQNQQQQQSDTVMSNSSSDMLEAQLACGIRNLTMHNLGVALLQIGQWDAFNADDIVQVRKISQLAEHGSRLGPRYQKITQKCLECDFGYGKDLNQAELQNAVYRDVVCELESLICTLEGRPIT